MTLVSKADEELGRVLYETIGKPLEADYWGKVIAIVQDGRFVLGSDPLEVAQRAANELGPDVFLFRIGDRAIGWWR